MTLDQEFAKYHGQSVLVPGEPEDERGQCVQWADFVLKDVYGFPYHYGNAIDWWDSPGDLLVHFDKVTDGSVKKGDFVIFNQLVGSIYGHIDVAMGDGSTASFQGADSNWGGNLTVHHVQHSNPSFVLGSLRLKGEKPIMIDDYHLNLLFQQFFGRSAEPDEHQKYVGKATYPEVMDVLVAQQAYKIATAALTLGQVAQRDNWQKQITDLQAEVKAGGNPTVLKPGDYRVN